jgi:two-component system, LytTR family, response regulator
MRDVVPVRVLIVDDERMARKRLRTLLVGESDMEIVGESGDGRDAVRAITETKPDLVFLDVQMPELDGFDVVRAIGVEQMPVVVFVTAFDQYALKAFEVHALDYLTKPFDRERFHAMLRRVREHLALRRASSRPSMDASLEKRLVSLLEEVERRRAYVDRLLVRAGGRVRFVRVDEIDWLEAADNYVRLHVARDSHLVHEGLGSLGAKLDPSRFVRIHRSTIVNLDRVKEVQPWFHGDAVAILRDGTKLSVSRNYRAALLLEGGSGVDR